MKAKTRCDKCELSYLPHFINSKGLCKRCNRKPPVVKKKPKKKTDIITCDFCLNESKPAKSKRIITYFPERTIGSCCVKKLLPVANKLIILEKHPQLAEMDQIYWNKYVKMIDRHNRKTPQYQIISPARFNKLMLMPCLYCGQQSGGIDRVNNKIGYTRDNSVPCCPQCNCIKHIKTTDQMKQHIERMYKHLFNVK